MQRALLILLALVWSAGAMAADKGEWVYPAIENYGKVRPYPDSKVQPSPDQGYKILFNVTKAKAKDKDRDKVNPTLDKVARLINVFALAKVPPQNLELVAVVHGDATAAVLGNEHYRKKYGIDNPNLELIKALKQAGATLYVCGQALAHAGFEPQQVDDQVELALAALTVLVLYQQDGYALIDN